MAKAIIPTQIKGEITLSDGTISSFLLFDNNEYTQWGEVDTPRLGRTVDIIEAMAAGLTNAGIVLGEEAPPVLDGRLVIEYDTDEPIEKVFRRALESGQLQFILAPGDDLGVYLTADNDDDLFATIKRGGDLE